MLSVTNEGMQWARNYCKEIKEKYPLMQEHKTPEGIKVMELAFAYQTGAQYIQNELAKVKARLREKSLENAAETDCTNPELICVKNQDVFAAYEEAIKQIDEIITL
jgi:hypothetical protein